MAKFQLIVLFSAIIAGAKCSTIGAPQQQQAPAPDQGAAQPVGLAQQPAPMAPQVPAGQPPVQSVGPQIPQRRVGLPPQQGSIEATADLSRPAPLSPPTVQQQDGQQVTRNKRQCDMCGDARKKYGKDPCAEDKCAKKSSSCCPPPKAACCPPPPKKETCCPPPKPSCPKC